MKRLPSERLDAVRPQAWIVVAALVVIAGTAAVLAIINGPIANTELKPMPASTTYPSALPLTPTDDAPTATPTPTPVAPVEPAAPVVPAPAPAQPVAPAQPAPHVPVKCPAGTVANAVADNGDESNCQAPCQAYDDNNVCISPGSLRWALRDPEVVAA